MPFKPLQKSKRDSEPDTRTCCLLETGTGRLLRKAVEGNRWEKSSVLPGFLKCTQPWPAARPDPSLSRAKPSPFNAFKLQSQPQLQGAQTFHLNEAPRSDPVLVQRSIHSIPAAFRSCLMYSSEKECFSAALEGNCLINMLHPSI